MVHFTAPSSSGARRRLRPLAALGRTCRTRPRCPVICSTSPRAIISERRSQSARSSRCSSKLGVQREGRPTRRSGSGLFDAASIGTNRTLASFRKTVLCSQSVSAIADKEMEHTKVDSRGFPLGSRGIVLSSMPSETKSGSARDAAVAPKAFSRIWPATPLPRSGSNGTSTPTLAPSSPSVSPASAQARAKSSGSFLGSEADTAQPLSAARRLWRRKAARGS